MSQLLLLCYNVDMKHISATLALVLLVLLVCSCTEQFEPQHEHDFNCGEEVLRIAPTCFTDGCVVVRCKSCDAENITLLPAPMAHTSDGGTVRRVDGHDVTTYTCTVCNEVISTKTEHHLSQEWSYDLSKHWHEWACGCEGTEDEGSHMYINTTTVYDATPCSDIRVTHRECVTCGYSYDTAVTTYHHTPGEPELSGGLSVTRCPVCGEILGIAEL